MESTLVEAMLEWSKGDHLPIQNMSAIQSLLTFFSMGLINMVPSQTSELIMHDKRYILTKPKF